VRSLSRVIPVVLLVATGACARRPRPVSAVSPAATPSGISQEEVARLWNRAMGDYTRGKWGKAATLFERLTLELPAGDSLVTVARFRLGECYFGQKNQLQAAREFRKVSDESPNAPLAPTALLRAGDAYADLWRRPELDNTYGETARSTYQELLNRYPDSPAAARARLQLAELEEMSARKEFKTAQYYFRLRAYDSAILYLKSIAASYPRAAVTPRVLLKLVDAYRRVGYAEDLQETCSYIWRFHPTTPGLSSSCPTPRDTIAAPATGTR
jgi:outer membrane protein assembly factor BamD